MKINSNSTQLAGIYGILGNIFLFIIKFITGIFFKSQSMIADSVNSACDIFSSLLTFIGGRISNVPRDEDHNFGHGKAEYIFSMIISLSMISLSIKLLIDTFKTLILGNSITFSWFLIFTCLITVFTKLLLYFYTKTIYLKTNSILVKSNMNDHRNDCFITLASLISIFFSLSNIKWVDSLVGLGISVWICYSGIILFSESYNVLMDKSIDSKTKEEILKIASSLEGIKGIEAIASSPVGNSQSIFIIINVDGNMSTFKSHNLADNLENKINSLPNVYKTIVHVNPI